MTAMDFLNYLCYIKDKRAEEKRQYDEQLRKNK